MATEKSRRRRRVAWWPSWLFGGSRRNGQSSDAGTNERSAPQGNSFANGDNAPREDFTDTDSAREDQENQKEDNIMSNPLPNNQTNHHTERTPYDIGMYFGLSGTDQEKKEYAAKIRSEIDTSKEKIESAYTDIKQHFDDLISLAGDAQQDFKALFTDLQEHKKAAMKSIKDAFIATLMVGLDEDKKGEIAEKLIQADIDSVSRMEQHVQDYLTRLSSIMEQLTDPKIGSLLTEKYKEAMDKTNSRSLDIQQLEKGYAFGVSIRKNLED